MASRVEGLARLRAKVLNRLPAEAKAAMKAANRKNAQEFAGLVRKALPRGDDKDGHLADTLTVADATTSETGVAVTLGDAGHPYPLHLEAGHRNADGSHTPGKPAWNPARRVIKKKAAGRASRAANKIIRGLAE